MDSSAPFTICSDEELLERFRQGEREAFGALVRRYEAELYGYLRRYLGKGDLADDVFQNTFLQVFTKIGQFEAGRRVRPWLYAVATNQAIDALRREGRHQAASIDLDREENRQGEWSQLLDMLETREGSPLDHVQTDERRQLVRAGVDRLPEFLKQVVLLAYFQELKYSDIAEILKIPVGTVKSRLNTALTRLNEAWKDQLAVKEG